MYTGLFRDPHDKIPFTFVNTLPHHINLLDTHFVRPLPNGNFTFTPPKDMEQPIRKSTVLYVPASGARVNVDFGEGWSADYNGAVFKSVHGEWIHFTPLLPHFRKADVIIVNEKVISAINHIWQMHTTVLCPADWGMSTYGLPIWNAYFLDRLFVPVGKVYFGKKVVGMMGLQKAYTSLSVENYVLGSNNLALGVQNGDRVPTQLMHEGSYSLAGLADARAAFMHMMANGSFLNDPNFPFKKFIVDQFIDPYLVSRNLL